MPKASRFSFLVFLIVATVLLLSPCVESVLASENQMVPVYVKKDTFLIKISGQYCIENSNWKDIARINNLAPPYTIYSGSTINIPLSYLKKKDVQAKVIYVKGEPIIAKAQGATHVVTVDDLFQPGDTLKTQGSEFVHIIFPDNKHILVKENSSLKFDYGIQLSDGSIHIKTSLQKGSVVNRIKKALKKQDSFNTQMGMAITGVRGTEYRVKLENQKSGIIETTKGNVAVSATGKSISVPAGKGTRVKKNQPPERPQSLPPVPKNITIDKLYKKLPVTINLPGQDNTIQKIRVTISLDSAGMQIVQEKTSPAGQPINIYNVDDNIYYLTVSSINKKGFESLPSSPIRFQVRTNPAPPMISAPKNNHISFTNEQEIKWLASTLASYYEIEVSKDKEFRQILMKKQVKQNKLYLEKLDQGDYYARVRTVTKDNFKTDWSPTVAHWQVLENALFDTSKLTGKPGEPTTITWLPVKNASGYNIQIAKDKNFQKIIMEKKGIANSEYTLEDNLEPGTYHVRLSCIINGQQSPWIPPQQLVIANEPFTAEELFFGLAFLAILLF